MDVTFTRSGERKYTTIVKRNDGVMLQVQSHDRPTALPHDIMHFIVERRLQLRQGFWGCVAAGAMFPGMQVISGRLRPHAEARSQSLIKAAQESLSEAEVLVSRLLYITDNKLDSDWPAAQKCISSDWQPRHPS